MKTQLVKLKSHCPIIICIHTFTDMAAAAAVSYDGI